MDVNASGVGRTEGGVIRPGCVGAAMLMAATLVVASAASAQPSGTADRLEPGASAWRTWVLSSASQFRLPPPPDAAATRAEIGQLRAMAAKGLVYRPAGDGHAG